jgi:2-dehydro-3-deoxygluconokinase
MKKVVTFGEIMLRLTPPGALRFSQGYTLDARFGGGESNVAVSLANYGIPVDFVSVIPDNDIGNWAISELRKWNVGTDKIVRQGSRLGIYFLEMGAISRGSKVVYDRAHSAIADADPDSIDWDEALADAEWFHWTGITPAISENAAKACLKAIQTANRLGVTVSTDLNYRKNLWKYGKASHKVMPELVEGCDVILGNEEDAEKHFGIHPESVDVTKGDTIDAAAYESVCRQLMEKFPRCRKVIITLRGSISASHNTWSGVLYNGTELLKGPDFEIIPIVDRVGGGDSFMGGLIYGLLTYDNDQEALDFAVAASCLKHTIYGDFNMVTVPEVEKLMSGDASGRVSR